jgi:hypothetical protein
MMTVWEHKRGAEGHNKNRTARLLEKRRVAIRRGRAEQNRTEGQ